MKEIFMAIIKVVLGIGLLELVWLPMVLLFTILGRFVGSLSGQSILLKFEISIRWIFRMVMVLSLVELIGLNNLWYERLIIACVVYFFMAWHEVSKEYYLNQSYPTRRLNHQERRFDEKADIFDFFFANLSIGLVAVLVFFKVSFEIPLASQAITWYLGWFEIKILSGFLIFTTIVMAFNTYRTARLRIREKKLAKFHQK